MKILFFAEVLRPDNTEERIGGGEISNILLLRELSINHEVYVFAAYGCRGWNESRGGMVYFDLSEVSWLAWLPKRLRVIVAKIIYRHLAGHVADIVKPNVLLSTSYLVDVVTRLAKRRSLVSGVFMRAFENFPEDSDRSFRGRARNLIRTMIYGNFAGGTPSRAGLLIPNSIFMKDKCDFAFGPVNTHVCYPPMTSKIKRREYPERIRTALMVSTDKKKGFDLFRMIATRLPDVKFSAVGDGSVQSCRQLSANLEILGWINNLEEILVQVDLVLVPSMWEEPFGRIAVEALRCGCLVLVSGRGGLPEAVSYQELLIVETDDVDDWVSRITSYEKNRAAFVAALSLAVTGTEKYCLKTQARSLELALLQAIRKRDA